jgi:small subunit ribosomal protein S16
MAVRIRLRRLGAKKRPFYRVVVADQRSPRDGRFIEIIGKYHPLEEPSLIEIDEEKALEWLRKGAQPSEQVTNLLRVTGIWQKFAQERPKVAAKESARRGPRSQAAKTPAEPKPDPKATAEPKSEEPKVSEPQTQEPPAETATATTEPETTETTATTEGPETTASS